MKLLFEITNKPVFYSNNVLQVYLALAKGGLVDDHLLILPIIHHQAAAHLPDSVTSEIHKYPFTCLHIKLLLWSWIHFQSGTIYNWQQI